MSRVAKTRAHSFHSRETVPVLNTFAPEVASPNVEPRVPVFLRDPRDEDRLRLKRDKQRSYDRRRRESAVHQGDTRLAYENFYAGGLLNIADPVLFSQRSFTMAMRTPDALLSKSLQSLAAPDFTMEINLDAEYSARLAVSPPVYLCDTKLPSAEKLTEHDLVLQSLLQTSEAHHAAVAAARFPSEDLAKAVASQQVNAQMLAIQQNHASNAKSSPNDMLENIRKRYSNLNVKLLPDRRVMPKPIDERLLRRDTSLPESTNQIAGSPNSELLGEADLQPWASRVPETSDSQAPVGPSASTVASLDAVPELDDSTVSPKSLASSHLETPTVEPSVSAADSPSWKLDQTAPALPSDPVFADNPLLTSLDTFKPHLFPF